MTRKTDNINKTKIEETSTGINDFLKQPLGSLIQSTWL